MQQNQGESENFGSLAEVIAILRYEGRQDLAALLADARLDFEYIDTGFSMTSDAEFEIVNAAIYAFISPCKALRNLPKDDESTILAALQEAWPTSQAGGMIIQSVSYNVDKDSLKDGLTHLYASPTGWLRVDRTMDRIRELLATTSTEEQFQEVGLLCREGLISMAQIIFDPTKHPSLTNDNTEVSPSHVKEMVSRYVSSEYTGSSNKEFRKCVNSTVDLANKVTHRRTSTYRDAVLCAQATFNVIGLISVISGKCDRDVPRTTSESHGEEN